MTSFVTDLRYALRSLRKTPAISIVAVITLAAGIGSVTSMYSTLRALVVDPFSYPQSDRIVHVWSNDGQPLSTPDYFDIKEQATSYAELGVYTPRPANLGGDHPQCVGCISCTSGVLRAFGVRPMLGRGFEPADDQKGAPQVAIISYRLWRENFGGNEAMVGQPIRLNEANVTLIGVMPPTFEFVGPWLRAARSDIWIPLQMARNDGDRGSHWMCAVGRLKDGVSIAAADGEIKAIGARLKAAHPETNSRKPFLVRSLQFEMTRFIGARVWMLFGAVVLVLLVACANVASMLLARGARRHGEFGVRIALGATRGRILRLAFAETLVLSVAGVVLGIALAFAAMPALRALAPVSEARKAAIVLDSPVLLFAIGIGVVTTLFAGLPPALVAMRVPVAELLRIDSRGAAGSRTRHRLLRGLIIAQIALAFILANGAALFSASYAKLLEANANLATEYVLSAELNLRGERYAKKEARAQFWQELADRVGALPGVSVAGLTSKLPLEGGSNTTILVNEEVFDPTAKRTLAEVSAVTARYFEAMGLHLLRGRTLQPNDAGDDTIGVVVNRTLAETCWPGKDPLGQLIRPSSPKPQWHARVIGVVESARQWGAEAELRPELYWTPDRAWGQTLYLIVRSSQPAAALSAQIRAAAATLDPEVPLTRIRTMQHVVNDATQGQRAVTKLVNFFMAVALGLVAVGLYGTLSYHVLQRTREIGVRMALGAGRKSILRLVLRQGSAWVTIGIGLGVGGALALATTLRALLYGVTALNPVTLLAASAAVALAAIVACWLPARRAASVDPIIALRTE